MAVRNRFVGDGLHEDLDISNHGLEPVELIVEFLIEADFADLFEVKALGRAGSADVARRIVPEQRLLELELEYERDGFRRATEVRLTARPAEISASGARFRATIPQGETWYTCIEVCLNVGAARCLPKCRCEAFGSLPVPLAKRAAVWREGFPELRSGWDALNHLYRQGADDLTALLMEDPDGQGDLVVAAGLPWFMTLFGRDAILTALMALPFDREMPAGVFRTLARHQGADEDEVSEEQPGKILHEIRFCEVAVRGGTDVYYGTVDATPLFVILVAETYRWGLDWDQVQALLPHVRRALDWMRTHGDPDRDGYLEYPGRTDRGLRNQGWKDSWDAVQFADGALAEGPIALAEVQGCKHRPLLDAAQLFDAARDGSEAETARGEATALSARFRRDFWLEELGYPALALDGEKRRVDAVASNPGHLLLTGILSAEQEAAVARRIILELFSGWGVRTLATSNRGYKPVSYHVGSVWPHDTAIAIAGLARAGFVAEALALATGLMDAAPHFSYRLLELFSGFPRDAFGFPVGYPTTSSPQAWAAASVLLLSGVLLGLQPFGSGDRMGVRPILPAEALPCRLERLRVGSSVVSLRVDPSASVEVTDVVEEGRTPQPAGTEGA